MLYAEDNGKLMTRRIRRILLVCSNYDNFTLEEDGRLEARIDEEYRELNLFSTPPSIERVESTAEAIKLVGSGERYDIVLTMCNVGAGDIFDFSKTMKSYAPDTPIVLLTSYSKEFYRQITAGDYSSIDFVFFWNNTTDLIIAIIKLIEDRMNAEHDICEMDVQAILLVEDSVRYYSSYLPMLYRLVLHQNSISSSEALNEARQIKRKRSRPKILLATNYQEAVELYQKYKNNLLGVISDVGFVMKKGDKSEEENLEAGIQLCSLIRKETPTLPVLLQSSQESLRERVLQMGVGFVVKNSKILNHEISEYILREFAFGDFVLRDHKTGDVIACAHDLRGLEQIILHMSDEALERLAATTYMSKWLKARGLFSLSNIFAGMSVEKDGSIEAHRKALLSVVRDFRIASALGVVARFNPENYDSTVWFSRLGNGSLGGKARGLAFMNSILQKHKMYKKWEDVRVMVPRTLVVTTEYFDRFINDNGLQYVINSDVSDEDILSEFVSSALPRDLMSALKVFLKNGNKPLAIRSSSLLEDSYYQPFAGVYSTYMIPRVDNEDQCLRLLAKAVKSVYASVYFASSRAYIQATGNVISEEKMAVVIQDICGSEQDGYFFPTLSGVARSLNFYPIGHEEPEDGIVKVAYGLGKAVVDGEQVLRFDPVYPKNVLQTSTVEQTVKETQQVVCMLNLNPEKFKTSVDDAVNICKMSVADCASFRNTRHVVSTFDYENMRMVDSAAPEGPKYVTFAQMLKYKTFPLAEICSELLKIAREEIKSYVEIEFAADLDRGEDAPAIFNVLQVRPISVDTRYSEIDWKDIDADNSIIESSSALGTGWIRDVHDVVYIKKDKFDVLKTHEMAKEIRDINSRMRDEDRQYVLIGFGRWGSSQPSLGVPVVWSDISEAKVIVESSLEDFRVDPSQGTHFFQNLTSFNVGYINVDPYGGSGKYDIESLDAMQAVSETEYFRVVRFEQPLDICIDGRGSKALIKI